MRTGQYRNINADVVYEGELRQTDKLTGAIDLKGEKKSEKVVGYFAHFELTNGFAKTLYMTVEEMANYALKFSPSFKTKEVPKVDDLIDMAQSQSQNGPIQGQVGWKGDFNAMAQKTVLRRLLSKYGFLSIEMMNALADDEPQQFNAEAIRDEENLEARPVINAAQAFDKAEEVKDEAPASQPEQEDKPDF
jgi:recombination protein RecT